MIPKFDIEIAEILGHEYAIKYNALPIKQTDQHLTVMVPHGTADTVLRDLADLTGLYIHTRHADAETIRYYISKLFGLGNINTIASQFLVEENLSAVDPEIKASISAAPVVRLLDSLIEAGVANGASDIHIEPFGQELRTRYRVDGVLINHGTVGLSILPSLISRLKIMGGLDIAETRQPQDGHFTLMVEGVNVEFRLSTLPTISGEKAAIRLLYDQSTKLSKDELGFFPEDLQVLTELFHKPHGAIFLTGPTGSGKSTTLNCFMAELNAEEKNIITIEDPVENPIDGVSHVKIERAVGFDFASALRHILRQDPDVIMVGEVRDEETARIAIQAANTGHVVLSTLHTNDAAGVIERLTDMGIEPYLAAAALICIVSQRLVRKLCNQCKITKKIPAHAAEFFGISPHSQVYEPVGCAKCNGTGYRGRIAVYEYVVINEDDRRQIVENMADFAALVRGRYGLKKNVTRNLLAGVISVAEATRVVGG